MDAVLDMLQAKGIETQENSMTSDAAVIWSVLWHGRMRANQAVYQHYRSLGRPVIVLEIGALYRGHTWKVAVNNITADGYYGHRENLDPDRPRRLGVSVAKQFDSKPHIVMALQHGRSEQVAAMGNMADWVHFSIDRLRQFTDRPIVVRPHPRFPVALGALPKNTVIQQPRAIVNSYDSFDMHFDCHAVINYNSGPGIQAAISGVRPIVDQSSLAYPVSISMANIEQPYDVDRAQWLIEICHTEYTLDELRQGLWLKRIETALA